jgi:ABC-2 type transport system permease protein
MTAWWPAAAALWRREVVAFLRQRSRVMVALLTPLLFWLLLGVGIGSNFRPEGAPEGVTYLEYFFPGSVVLVLLFTGIFSFISLIRDRQEGFLQGVLVAPVPRSAIAFGKIAGGATLAVIQAALFLAAGWAAGIPIDPAHLPGHLAALTLVAFGLGGMGFAIAWRMDSIQGFHGVMNLLLMPMWLLSGAFFPLPEAGILRWAMSLNPLTYGLAAARVTLGGPGAAVPGTPPLGYSLGVTLGFAVVMLVVATRVVESEGQ